MSGFVWLLIVLAILLVIGGVVRIAAGLIAFRGSDAEVD